MEPKKFIDVSIFKEIFDNGRIGYWDWDIPSGEEYFSPAMKKMFGYEDNEIPNMRESVSLFIFKDDFKIAMEKLDTHVKSHGEIPFSCELRNHHKNGSTVWVLTRGKVIEWDADGNPVRMVGCNIDITDQKQSEENQKNLAANLQAVVGSTNDIIASYDKERRLIVFNKAYSDIYRKLFKVEIYPGMRPSDLFSETMQKYWEAVDKRALSGESFTIEFDLANPDGDVRSYEESICPIIASEAITGFTTFARDITERKRTERALYENEENYRTLVNNMQDAVYRCDLEGNITFVSPSAATLLGYPSTSKLIGANIAEKFYLYPEQRQKLIEIMKVNGMVSEYEVTLKRSDGTSVVVRTNSHFYKDSSGKVIGIEGVYHDVTEQTKAEEAIKKSEALLRSIFEASPAGIALAFDRKFTKVNDAMCRITGYSENELIGQSTRIVYMSDEDFERTGSVYQELEKNGFAMTEAYLRNKNGNEINALLSLSPLNRNNLNDGVITTVLDITDLKKAEQIIKENESFLKSLFNASPSGIAQLVNRKFVKVNKAFCSLTGYSEEELENSSSRILYFDENEYNRVGLVYNTLDQKESETIETRYRKKDGTEIFVVLCLSRLDQDDIDAGVVATLLDITEMKQAEKQLKENQAILQSIFEASPTGIVMLVNREFVKINKSMCQITGYSEDELYGTSTRILYFDDDEYNRVGQIYRGLEKMSPGIIESRFRRKDGTEINVIIGLNPLDLHNMETGVVATILDITQIKKAEQALKKNESLMQSIFNASPAGITLLYNRVLSMTNEALCRITGYNADELIGKNARIFYFDDEEYQRIGSLYKQIEKNGMVITESRFRKKDGNEINVLICFNTLDSNDFSAGIVATLLDITELKKMEYEKKKLEEMLLHSQKLESIGRLAGGIAHDFNNMLTAILGNAELVKQYISTSSKAYTKLETIEKAALSAANLTRQLLAFSRKQVIEPKILNLNDAIKNIQKMILTLLGENITLDMIIDDCLNEIKVDPGQIEQIILNLSVNARDAMSNGGRLIIETKNTILDDAYSKQHLNIKPGQFVMLSVSDTGSGMTKEIADKCFEPFFTTKEKGKGTGLGLSTVYGIVNQAGGTIEVYSEVGKGTVFKLYFPVVNSKNTGEMNLKEPDTLKAGNETILIAEDNEFVLQFCMDILLEAGYKVMSAETGEDALNIALNYNEKIHLLITDVILPGINGKETSEKMKTIHQETKILYNSGYTAEVIDKQGMLDEGIDFISKPYTAKQLLSKVREILDREN